MLLLLAVAVVGTTTLTSCNDEPGSGKNDLVGTWYYYDEGDIDYDYFLEFKKNGKCYDSDDEVEYRYEYDPKTSILTIYYEDGDEDELSVEFITSKKILIDGECYVKK